MKKFTCELAGLAALRGIVRAVGLADSQDSVSLSSQYSPHTLMRPVDWHSDRQRIKIHWDMDVFHQLHQLFPSGMSQKRSEEVVASWSTSKPVILATNVEGNVEATTAYDKFCSSPIPYCTREERNCSRIKSCPNPAHHPQTHIASAGVRSDDLAFVYAESQVVSQICPL